MKNARKDRVIIAALIHGGPALNDPKHLMSCATTVLSIAWGDFAPPPKMEITIAAEGAEREGVFEGEIELGWFPLDRQERAIASVENAEKAKKGARRSGPDKPNLMLGVGSREFCMAFVHLWATSPDKEGAHTWGFHMLRKLATSDPRTVVWYDTQNGKMTFGDIGEMYTDVRKMLAANS